MLYTVKEKPISKHISRQSNTAGSRLSDSTFAPLIIHCLTVILFAAVFPSFPPLTFTSYSKLMNSPQISFTPPCLTGLGDFPLYCYLFQPSLCLRRRRAAVATRRLQVGGSQRSILRELLMGARSRAEMELTAKVPVLMGSSPGGARREALEVACWENKHVLQQWYTVMSRHSSLSVCKIL